MRVDCVIDGCNTSEDITEEKLNGDKNISHFYKCSHFKGSNIFIKKIGVFPICKTCLNKMVLNKDNNQIDEKKFISTLKLLNRPFVKEIFDKCMKSKNKTFGEYLKRINMKQYKDWTYDEGDNVVNKKINENIENSINITSSKEEKIDDNSKQSKSDCIRLLGYDPFLLENEKDKPKLYNGLIDYLDDSTLHDSFKVPVCIQIVTTFNQIDKINQAISFYTSDPKLVIKEASSIKTLMDSKKNMLSSILNMAKDNGISINYNNNKSKGTGTLNDIVRELDELGLESAEINLFNLETSESIEQVSDISNRSILKQLVLDENDYTAMLSQQKEIINKMDKKVMKLEEENRLLKKNK